MTLGLISSVQKLLSNIITNPHRIHGNSDFGKAHTVPIDTKMWLNHLMFNISGTYIALIPANTAFDLIKITVTLLANVALK